MSSARKNDHLVGADLGDFVVEEFLDSGGMADVYRGRQKPPIEQVVAIKFLHPHWARERDVVARFRKEAYISGLLNGPNIVRVLAYGELEERLPYLVMEFVDGSDLKRLQKQDGTLPVPISILILRDVLMALEDAHRHNVIHRDLKLSNVLVSHTGDVKLADFGIARATEAASELTQEGGLLGSVPYMSPEQTRGTRLESEAGKLSDIFSMGIMAYELLAGERPFDGDGREQIMDAIREREPRSLLEYRRPIPPEVVSLVHAMLVKDPAQRWKQAGSAVKIFEVAIQHLGVQGARERIASYMRDPVGTAKQLQKKGEDRRKDLDETVGTHKQGQSARGDTPWWRVREVRLIALLGTILVGAVLALTIPIIQRALQQSAKADGVLDSEAPNQAVTPVTSETRLSILTNPPGATVRVDGEIRGVTPLIATLTGDSATVELARSGFESTRERLWLPGGEREISRTLRPAGPFERRYRINTWPAAAMVYVDDAPNGHEMVFEVLLREGEHRFRAVNQALGLDVVLKYRVRKGDTSRVLQLDFSKNMVVPDP